MATLFLSLSKNVSCTSTLQGKHLCQISWELVTNWGSSSRRKIGDRPPDRIGDRPPDDTLIPIYPPYTLRVCGGIIKPNHYPPRPRSLGLLSTRTTPHKDHYHGIKPLIRTNTCTVGNCPGGELSGYAYKHCCQLQTRLEWFNEYDTSHIICISITENLTTSQNSHKWN